VSTAIGFECDGGVVLAADRGLVRDGRVVSTDLDRLWEFADGAVGLAAVGGADAAGRRRDDPDAVRRSFDAALREYRVDRGVPTAAAAARLAADVAEEFGADLVLAARDDDGVARVRAVRADGSVAETATVAVGSGVGIALGALEGVDRGVGLDAAAAAARDLLEGVAGRDTETAEAVDVRTLADG